MSAPRSIVTLSRSHQSEQPPVRLNPPFGPSSPEEAPPAKETPKDQRPAASRKPLVDIHRLLRVAILVLMAAVAARAFLKPSATPDNSQPIRGDRHVGVIASVDSEASYQAAFRALKRHLPRPETAELKTKKSLGYVPTGDVVVPLNVRLVITHALDDGRTATQSAECKLHFLTIPGTYDLRSIRLGGQELYVSDAERDSRAKR